MPPESSQHESFSFDSTSSSSDFPKKLDPISSSLSFPNTPAPEYALEASCYAPISSSEKCSSKNKVNFNHEDLRINGSV